MSKNLFGLLKKCKSNKLFSVFNDYLFPSLCILCDSIRDNGQIWFCKECNEHLIQNSKFRQSCPRCSQNESIRKCACHISWDFPFEKIYSIFDYDERVQLIVKNIKYRGKKRLASALAAFSPHTFELKNSFDSIVPVPLYWARYQKRGYNQAEWFAKGIADCTGLTLLSKVLVRTRTTGTQTKLDRTERRNNMKKAFKVNESFKNMIMDKRVLLADDVVTTGATTASCAEVLLNAGCKSVSIVSIARD